MTARQLAQPLARELARSLLGLSTETTRLQPPSGSAFWLRAQNESYSNGANVSQWSDISGNARHFTIGSNYPTFATNANNGKSAIVFNGTNQGLNRSYTGSGTAYTISGIIYKDSSAFRLWWQNGVDPYIANVTASSLRLYRGSVLDSDALLPWSNWIPIAIRVSGVNAEIWIGKTKVASGTVSSGPLAIAGLCNLASFEWDGKLQEVIAYETALSNEDLESLVDYLVEQAGVTFGRCVICDGDSLTAGVSPATSWPDLLDADTTDLHIRNFALGGQTITYYAGATGYLNSDVVADVDPYSTVVRLDGLDPICVAWAGTNDIYYGGTGTQAHTDFAAYCTARRSAGFKVIAINMIARLVGGSWTVSEKNAYNALFAANVASYSDAQIDAAAIFTDETDTAVFNADQVHLNTAGNQIIANAVRAIIEGGI